jgi:hypothetical protein
MNLTNSQIEALKEIARQYGKRVLITRTQVGIGDSGVVAFDVVYSHGRRQPWQLRTQGQTDKDIKRQMGLVLA